MHGSSLCLIDRSPADLPVFLCAGCRIYGPTVSLEPYPDYPSVPSISCQETYLKMATETDVTNFVLTPIDTFFLFEQSQIQAAHLQG